MKFAKYTVTSLLILIIFFGYNKWVFSWGLFDLFSENTYTEEGLQKVHDFDPEEDILYLPKLSDKEIFESARDLSICRKKEVRKYIYIYLTTGREYVKKSIERSYLYIDIINDIFAENKDIPPEIALLPLLESGFDPTAVSRSNAVGLWQFLKSTSKHFDLKGDKWVEERRDIEKSTLAAIRHLRNLNNNFKSWDLALAAYNGGGGQVRRAMNKTGAKSIWQLIEMKALTRETSEYVPRYIALMMIYKNQKLFGIEDEIRIPSKEKTENIVLKYSVNINQVSRICDVEKDTIMKFNPELKRTLTPPTVKDYTLRLPVKAKNMFKSKSKTLYKEKIRRIKAYRVRKGDTVSRIAVSHKKKHLSSYA